MNNGYQWLKKSCRFFYCQSFFRADCRKHISCFRCLNQVLQAKAGKTV